MRAGPGGRDIARGTTRSVSTSIMRIPLVDLVAQYHTIQSEIDAAIERVVRSGCFVLGEEVAAFEREFATYCGTAHAVGTSSGQAALHLALVVLGIGPGDEVITTPFTFFATAAAIRQAGARPVFVDIDRRSFALDGERLREIIERDYYFNELVGGLIHRVTHRRLRAVLPVHLYGQIGEMKPLLDLAARYNLRLIEDAAQAHGAEVMIPSSEDGSPPSAGSAQASEAGRWRRAGSLGHAACFSFYPSKNLGAYGDAGAVVTSDQALAERMRRLVNQGRTDKYIHGEEGFNYRLDALHAAILRVKLRYLDQWNAARRRIAAWYRAGLADLPDLILPEEPLSSRHVYHLYVIRCERRDELLRKLTEQGIGAAVHYPVPLHLQPAFRVLGYREGDFPIAEECARTVLSLPIYPELSERAVEQIVGVIRSALTG